MEACSTIVRFLAKSLDFEFAHSLEVLGGPKMTQIPAYMESSMERAAHKTLNGYEEQCKMLKTLSLDANTFGSLGTS